MKISIVTPSYNQAEFIDRTIQSIWSQKGDFFIEHIIADGGSTDNTVEIIRKYEKLLKSKKIDLKCKGITLKWWSRKDKGQADAIIKGFDVAQGDILNWINSDDIFIDEYALSHIEKTFQKTDAEIVVGRGWLVDETNRKIGEFSFLSKIESNEEFQTKLPTLLKGDFICQQSLFFKKALLKRIQLDDSLHYCMDWDLYIKFYKKNCKFLFIKEDIGALREQPDAKTQIMPIAAYKERLKLYSTNQVWCAGRLHSYFKVVFYNNKVINALIDKLTSILASFLSLYNNRKLT